MNSPAQSQSQTPVERFKAFANSATNLESTNRELRLAVLFSAIQAFAQCDARTQAVNFSLMNSLIKDAAPTMSELAMLAARNGATTSNSRELSNFASSVKSTLDKGTPEGISVFRGTASIVVLDSHGLVVAVFEHRNNRDGSQSKLYTDYGDLGVYALRKAVWGMVLATAGKEPGIGSSGNQKFLKSLQTDPALKISIFQGSYSFQSPAGERYFLGGSGIEFSDEILKPLGEDFRKATCDLGGAGDELFLKTLRAEILNFIGSDITGEEPEIQLIRRVAAVEDHSRVQLLAVVTDMDRLDELDSNPRLMRLAEDLADGS